MRADSEKGSKLSRFAKWFIKTKKGIAIVVVVVLFAGVAGAHELAVRHFQSVACGSCHEMSNPVECWKESGTAVNHPNCASCHYDAGFKGWWTMNKDAFYFFFKHFQLEEGAEIKPPEEPIFIDPSREPGYYSLVPNHRCFKCKDTTNDKGVKTHTRQAQIRIHSEDIDNILEKPCKDCHNHEMRKGQKFCPGKDYDIEG